MLVSRMEEDLKSEKNRLTKLIRTRDKEIETLKKEMKAGKDEKKEVDKKLKEMTKEMDGKDRVNNGLRNMIRVLKNELEIKNEEIDKLSYKPKPKAKTVDKDSPVIEKEGDATMDSTLTEDISNADFHSTGGVCGDTESGMDTTV